MPTVDTGPGTLNWLAYAGDRNLAGLRFRTADDTPWDITGAQLAAQARVSDTSDTVAVAATITVTDPVAGLGQIEWDGDEVRTLLDGESTWEGVWDMQIVEQGQTLPRTLLRGTWTARHDITRTP